MTQATNTKERKCPRHLFLRASDDEWSRDRAHQLDKESRRSGGLAVSQSDIVTMALAFYQDYPDLVENHFNRGE